MPVKSVPERLRWAVETLAIDPSDHLLEIGCGRGVAVSLICEKLGNGRITAIDRSATMVNLAEQRNAENIASGKAAFRTMALETADLDPERFTKIFAINVNLFWVRPAARELDLVERLLRPAGTFYLFYEPPGAPGAARLAERLAAILTDHGFSTTTRMTATARSTALVCVTAQLP